MSARLPSSGRPAEHPYRVRAVDRALDLLAEFTDPYLELSLVQLTARSGLAKPTVYRLLATLCQRGFVEQSADSRAYRLGRVYLGQLADAGLLTHRDRLGFTANDACARRMQAFAVATAVALGLSVRVGDRRVVVARAEPSAELRTDPAAATGASSPLWADPAGWLLLAAMGRDEARAYVERRGCEAPAEEAPELPAWPGGARFLQGLERIRSDGWAEGPVRAEGGAAMVAAPVRDLRGHVVAALHTFASEAGHGDAEALRAAVINVAQGLSGGPEGPCGPVAGAPPIGPVTD